MWGAPRSSFSQSSHPICHLQSLHRISTLFFPCPLEYLLAEGQHNPHHILFYRTQSCHSNISQIHFSFILGKSISQISLNRSQYILINKCVLIFPLSIINHLDLFSRDEQQTHPFKETLQEGIATNTRQIIGPLSLFPALPSPIHSSQCSYSHLSKMQI